MKTKNDVILASALFLAALLSAHAETTFTKITAGAIATDTGVFTRGVWGDFHNTGFLDLILCYYNGSNVYYQNKGDGTFARINTGNLVTISDYYSGSAVADYDNDGHLDLLVAAGAVAPSSRFPYLYNNNGDGTFNRVFDGVVSAQRGFLVVPAWADYDNDGFVDLFVSNDGTSAAQTGGTNLLFKNNGNGTSTKVTSGPIVQDNGIGWCALWADYDNDGFDDLLVINLVNNGHNFLYHNNRDGTFAKITTNAVASDVWSTGAECGAWGDYDNDGYLDLFMASSPGNDVLYHNNGDGTFTQVLTGDPANDTGGNSCAWVDYDNDGFLDLFVTTGSGTHNLLYHNDGNTNGWLEVKLVGTVSNRSAIGAKVRAHATIGGKTFWQMREINTGGGWNSVPLVAQFGFGDATNVDTLRIEWPSGLIQEIQNVAPKQILILTEPPRLLATKTGGVPQFSLKGGRGFQYEVDSSSDLSTWSPIGSMTITNLNGIAQIIDTNPAAIDQRFYRAILQ